jgi:hypothetical protein
MIFRGALLLVSHLADIDSGKKATSVVAIKIQIICGQVPQELFACKIQVITRSMVLADAMSKAFPADSAHSRRTSSCSIKARAKSDKESFFGLTTINKSIKISLSSIALGLDQAKHMLKIT